MATHRLVITQVSEIAGANIENKVFEQCFENLDLTTLILAVNKRVRVRKQRESKPKA